MSWTPAQLKAIETRDKTLLISAAAGSGKTAVLIERIIRLLTDPESPMDISRLLIVTFTRAAASELRQRISKALSVAIAADPTNKRLFKQLAALGSAHISTIDSFYADVVRKYSAKLGIPSSLRLADESELIPMRRSIMNDVLDMGYRGEFDDLEGIKGVSYPNYKDATPFTAFADSISDMRNGSKTWETLVDLYKKLLSHPKAYKFILDCENDYVNAASSDFFETVHGKVIKDYLIDNVEIMIPFLEDAVEYLSADKNMKEKYLPSFDYDLDFCRELLDALKNRSYVEVRSKMLTYSAIDLKRLSADQKTPECEYYSEFRKKFVKEKLESFKEGYFSSDCSEGALVDYAMRSAIVCRVLYAVLSKFEELYSKEKLERGICEFSDIKQWAYRLLVTEDGAPTDIAREISESFDAVYIDEYQDVDPVQDLIFRAVSKPAGRFMVGDVKQSIYGFRGSEPTLFMDYRSRFAEIDVNSEALPDEDDCTIFMSSNFRCDENVIKFANTVCSYIFKTAKGGIEYTDGDDLIFAKNKIDGYTSPDTPVPAQVVLIDRSKSGDDKDEEFSNLEAAYIALEIKRLINYETKANGKKITAGDIAVFSRGEKFLNLVGKELDKLNIKHSGGKGTGIFEDPEVMIALSLMHSIDNPHKDIYMAGALMSPAFGFSADEVISLRHENEKCSIYDSLCKYAETKSNEISKKCLDVIDTLSELRDLSRSLSSDKILRLIFSRFSMLSRNEEGTSRSALLGLYENARSFEGSEFKGLYSYLCYVDGMIENDKAPSIDSESDNAVQLMTIHKSKGLEFPVCFVASTYSAFNKDDTKKVILYSSRLGLSADMLDADGFGKIKTPYQSALARQIIANGTEEEMRLLYVALTRARERLYVTASPVGAVKNVEKLAEFYARYSSRGTVMNVNNYITWILSSLYMSRDRDFFNITTVNGEDISVLDGCVQENENGTIPRAEYGEDIAEAVKRNFEFEYSYLHVSNIPAKLSVSKLSPDVLDRSTNEEEAVPDTIDVSLPDVYVPSFMSETGTVNISPAERGTATHTFLQFCDFEKAQESGVKKELDRLLRDKFIDERMASAVNQKQIEAFLESDFLKSVLSAKRTWREQRFNILLPASAFTEDEKYKADIKDEKLLVQGVMDIFFEAADGSLVLCDYKTDYLTPEEINDRSLATEKLNSSHARQLSYYAEALKNMFGKYPDKVLIYSLPLGDTVEITTSPVL